MHYQRLVKEVEHLFDVKKHKEKAVTRLGQLEAINDTNKLKLEKFIEAIDESEKEQGRIRTRMQKQVDDQKDFAITKFAADILEIFDNLNRALESCPEGQRINNPLYEGVEMTSSIGNKVLKRYQINPIDTELGSDFNYEVHECVFDQYVPGYNKGQIIYVMQPGYTIGERVLRVAKVGVAREE